MKLQSAIQGMAITLAAILSAMIPAWAERGTTFDLDTCTGESKLIVQGQLNAAGQIEISHVLKGDAAGASKLVLAMGSFEYQSLQRTMGGSPGPLKVVAFLQENVRDEWQAALQYAGVVGFQGDFVFTMQEGMRAMQFQKSEGDSKAAFLRAVADAVQLVNEREKLLAEPHSAERARQITTFALAHGRPVEPKSMTPWSDDYVLRQLARGLKNPSPEEQAALLSVLRNAKSPRDETILLNLSGLIPLKNDGMDALAAFLPRTNPPEVRIAAMDALAAIDSYRVIDYLSPYLTPDDPQGETILENFGSLSEPPHDALLNIKAVDALDKLANFMISERAPFIDRNELSLQMAHYVHPRLLPLLRAWAFDTNPARGAHPFAFWEEATGIKAERENRAVWDAWWEKALPFLKPAYDLQTAAGRDFWFKQYAKADSATQGILMNLWFFEPKLDEAALIEMAAHNETAKTVLAELWQRQRLSGEAKKMIIQRFLAVTLEDHPPTKNERGFRASVKVSSSFPFPEAAWFDNRRTLTFGDIIPAFQDEGWNEWSLQEEGVNMLGFSDSAQDVSPPQARAIVQLRYAPPLSSPDQSWIVTWNLGPIPLSNGVK